MRCDETLPVLEQLHDNELPEADRAGALDHIEECPRCRQEWHMLVDLRARCRSYAERLAVPDTLTQSIQAKLDACDRRTVRAARLPYYLLAAAAVVAVISLSIPVITGDRLARIPGPAASPTTSPHTEITDSPVLAVGELVRHYAETIRPGQTAENPPDVSALAGQTGFSVNPVNLPGWQLAHAGAGSVPGSNRPVAHLIYRRSINGQVQEICCFRSQLGAVGSSGLNEHIIAGRKLCCGEIDGLSVVHLTEGQTELVLVSDMDTGDLLELAKQV